LPLELREFLLRPVDLASQPDPSTDYRWSGELPDLIAWLDGLGRADELEGKLQVMYHLVGTALVTARDIDVDLIHVLATLEPVTDAGTSGLLVLTEQAPTHVGLGSISSFLVNELRNYWIATRRKDQDADDPVDPEFVFPSWDCSREPPPAVTPEPGIVDAWTRRGQLMTDYGWGGRSWVSSALGEGVAPWELSAMKQNLARWNDERARLAHSHADGVYWLLAHWLHGDDTRLRDAVAVTADNPSRLVTLLRRQLVDDSELAAHFAERRTRLATALASRPLPNRLS
jgi:hypothetical protein